MASDWEVRQLKDCAVWYSGGTPSKAKSEYWGGAIPWISAKSLKEFFVSDSEDKVTDKAVGNGTRLVPKDTILFIVRGMSLKKEFRMGITTRPVTFNQDLKALVPVADVFPDFLAYAIRAKTPEILELVGEAGHGTGVLPTDRIQSLPISLPPINEQKAIAHIFRSLDDKIELNRRMNETLEAMSQALFKSWFIDFDPVIDNALAAGNLIPEEFQPRAAVRESLGDACKPLPEHDSDLFPSEFEFNDELGWFPKGWVVGSLEDMVVLQRGFDLPKTSRTDGTYPLIAASGQDGTHKVAKVTGPGVVTGRSGKLGIVTFVQEDFWPLNTTLWVKEYKNSSPYHAYLLLRTLGFERFNAGSAVPTLNRNHIHGMKLVVPPKIVIAKFSNFSKSFFDRNSTNSSESKEIVSLRDIMLKMLISGEIRVSDYVKYFKVVK